MGNRPKMDRSERAKQFMPFDAVKGLQEALRAKEQEVEAMQKQQTVDEEDLYDEDEQNVY